MQFPVLGGQHGRWSYKWTVVLVVVFGSFMSILDQTVINNAIPRLQSAFATGSVLFKLTSSHFLWPVPRF